MEPELINEEDKKPKVRRKLTRAEEVELKLTGMLEERSNYLEERINQLDTIFQEKLTKLIESITLNTQIIQTHGHNIKTLQTDLQQKCNTEELNGYKEVNDTNIKNLKEKLEDNKQHIEKYFNNEVNTINKLITDLHTSIKQTIETIENINAKFREYLTMEEFKDHIESVRNNTRELKEELNLFYNNINPSALLKQDNKPDTKLLKNTPNTFLQHLFNEFTVDVNNIVKAQNEQLEYMNSVMTMLKKNLNLHLYSAAKKAVTQLKGEGLLSIESHSLHDSFQAAITKKCDFSELQSLNDLKANKSDLEQVHNFSLQTHSHLKYTIILLSEFMNIFISNAKESKTEKVVKLSYVAYQLSLFNRSLSDNKAKEEHCTEENSSKIAIKAKSIRLKTQGNRSSLGKFTHRYNRTLVDKFHSKRNMLIDSR